MGYNYWKASQGIEYPQEYAPPQSYEDTPCAGFYRKGIYEKVTNKRNTRVGWEPVAVFASGDDLVAVVGSESIDSTQLRQIWTYICGNTIPEAWFRAVSERGEQWPDEIPPKPVVPAANRNVAASDNAPPSDDPPEVVHGIAVDNAISAAVRAVTNEAEAAQALGSKNRIAELRLAADKAGKAIYEPMYRLYTAEQKKWSPIVTKAQAAEKSLNTMVLTFREKERQRVAAEQAQAVAKQRELDEANARAADRAIAAGIPEPEPVVEEQPEPVAPAPILPTYGSRKLKEELKKFVVIDDIHAVFVKFKSDPLVVEILTKLAQAELNAGRNTPGTHYREGLI